MRRLLLTLLLVAALPLSAQASVSQVEVVISGDSISRLSEANLMGNGRIVDAEDGRNAYQRGMSNRMSSNEAMQFLIPMVQPGGTFVFQDNGAGATPEQWTQLLRGIVSRLPDDRCLLGVLPVWVAPGTPAQIADAGLKAGIMVTEFAVQPCHDWVRWNQAVAANPGLVYDGQHPTVAGSTWLGDQVTLRTGHVMSGDSCSL